MPFVEQVQRERETLEERIARLAAFCASPHSARLDPEERALLLQQLGVMQEYSLILTLRLRRFGARYKA